MKIVPTPIEQYVNRVDRTPSLVIGIISALVALWSLYSLFALIYAASVLSSYGFSPVGLIFAFVFRAVILVVTAFVAIAFLTRYAKGPQ
jgi:hypothetical protein